jgi:tetratricopeptide (TPR) repeat protein
LADFRAPTRLDAARSAQYTDPVLDTSQRLPGEFLGVEKKGTCMQFRYTRAAVVIVGLAVASSACGKYSIGSIRSLKAFKDGLTEYEKGNYRAAVEDFDRAVGFNPEFGYTYFYLGNSYDNQFRPGRKGEPENDAYLPKAVENYRLAIDKLASATDEQGRAFRKLSYEYLIAAYGADKLDDFAKAEPVAKELISLDPNEATNYQALAKLYEDQGRYEDAEAMFIKATEVKSTDPLNFQLLAGYYNRQGEFEKTMAAFQKRADLEPMNPEAWHTIGSYYYDKSYRDKSLARDVAARYVAAGLAAEDKAVAINPKYFEAVTYQNLLIRVQVLLERNPAEQKRLLQKADELREKALALQKEQGTAEAAAKK